MRRRGWLLGRTGVWTEGKRWRTKRMKTTMTSGRRTNKKKTKTRLRQIAENHLAKLMD